MFSVSFECHLYRLCNIDINIFIGATGPVIFFSLYKNYLEKHKTLNEKTDYDS